LRRRDRVRAARVDERHHGRALVAALPARTALRPEQGLPMFPAPIARRSTPIRAGYATAVLLLLVVWLLPLAGVALTSMRSIDDLNRGNFWGWPTDIRLFENYATVLAG